MQARNDESEKRPPSFRHRPLGQSLALTARNCPYLREGPKRLPASAHTRFVRGPSVPPAAPAAPATAAGSRPLATLARRLGRRAAGRPLGLAVRAARGRGTILAVTAAAPVTPLATAPALLRAPARPVRSIAGSRDVGRRAARRRCLALRRTRTPALPAVAVGASQAL